MTRNHYDSLAHRVKRVFVKVPLDNASALAAAIGQRVRELRESAGITQEKLAYESGLRSKGTLSKIESGQQLASVAVLDLLARRLGVELLDLFVRTGPEQPRHELIERSRFAPSQALRAARDALAPSIPRPAPPPFVEVERSAPGALPLLGMDIAAGGFDAARVDLATRWVRPRGATSRRVPRESFIVRVVGRSMEPTLRDESWAIFCARVSPDPSGKVVIAQYGGLVDADTAASYTVKRFRGTAAALGADARWSEARLEPDNPSFEPIVVRGERLQHLSIVAELVAPL